MTNIIGGILLGLVCWFFAFKIAEISYNTFRKSTHTFSDFLTKILEAIGFLVLVGVGSIMILGSIAELINV